MRYFIFGVFYLFGTGCSSAQSIPEICKNKISYSLQKKFADPESKDSLNIIITINDTTGLKSAFPNLRFANPRIALGQVTREEIISLCRHTGVTYIELPKTLYPKK